MNYWKQLQSYNIGAIKRYAAGFPYDEKGEITAECLDGEWDFKLVENPKLIPIDYEKVGSKLDGFGISIWYEYRADQKAVGTTGA